MKTKHVLLSTFLLSIVYCLLPTVSSAQTPGEWTWMHGDNTPNSLGVFGTMGVSSPSNKPPALYEPCEWTDKNDNFWVFGGCNLLSGLNVYAALWKYDPITNQWTWIKGPSTINQNGVYGTQGVPSPANYPGARGWGAVTWTDASGNLWLFGGDGLGAIGGFGILNDLWKYDIAINEWTWMKGPDTVSNSGINSGFYGTKGTPDPANLPPSRAETSCSWSDNANNLWLYGGIATGPPSVNGQLGDLWKYDISTNEWTWMHGAKTVNAPAVYGTQGVAAPANTPGGRQVYCSWTDLTGNLWLFGGNDYWKDSTYNDLWKYDITINQWIWIKGPNTFNDPGNYGTKCVSANSNVPPARMENRARVRDTCGNFWNFGGLWGKYNNGEILNDLWHYNVFTNQWTWMSGDNILNQAAVYGTKGISSPANKPGAKTGSVAWIDKNGFIWVFGGCSSPPSLGVVHNDLFRYVPDPACVPVCNTTLSAAITSTNIFCNGQCTGTATVTPTSGTSPYTYSWNTAPVQTTQTAIGLCAQTYSVLVTDASGATATANVTITQPSAITTSATATPAACGSNNGTATVTASGGTPSYTYLWNNGNTTSSSWQLAVGSYSVLITDANSCTQTATVAVTQSGGPTAFAGTTVTILSGSSTSLTASGGAAYSWAPSTGLSCATCANPVASPTVTIEYCVYVFDTSGCFDSACVTVFVVEPLDCANAGELYLPNAFSPNGDGENDILKIYYGDMRCIETFKLVIYNRWGEKVFTATDPSKAWDGMYRGKYENAAVFVYYIKVTLISGEEITKKGNISLIR